MRYDVILVGGGLSSLVCGVLLQRAGRDCMIISSGQNALHFSSGAFGLLSRLPDGTPVDDPFAAVCSLPAGHPYSKIGKSRFIEYVRQTPDFFASCGITLTRPQGVENENIPASDETLPNGYRLTPLGSLRPAWLAIKDVPFFGDKNAKIGDKALIVNFSGFLDFNPAFIADGLAARGTQARTVNLALEDIERLRKNPSEMRSVNIARVMALEKNWKEFAGLVKENLSGEDTVIVPDVFGFSNPSVPQWLREMIPARLLFAGTIPPSVPGIRAQMLLKKAFEAAGGSFLMGDTAMDPQFEGDRVLSLKTANLGETRLYADNFVLATGSFFGKGLSATHDEVIEPVFGLDVACPRTRDGWYDADFFAKQEYLGFGVKTDKDFRAFRNGRTVENLYVAGAEIGDCNPLYEGSGAGIAILSAFHAAKGIISNGKD